MPPPMGPTTVLVVAARELRARLRDRSAVISAFVAPLALASILSLALGGIEDFDTTFVVVDLDGGPVATAFLDDALGALEGVVSVVRAPHEPAARALLDAGDAGAGIVLPEGLSAATVRAAAVGSAALSPSAGLPVVLTVLRAADRPLSGDLAEAVVEGFAARLSVTRDAVVAAIAAGATDDPATLAMAAAAMPPAVALEDLPADVTAGRSSYFGPAMAVFFVYFVVGAGPRGLLEERRAGTLARLLAAPVRPVAVVAGKLGAVVLLAFLSVGVLWGATTLLFRSSWGWPPGVLALMLAVVLAATGVTALVATLARTDQQADGYLSVAAFGLALLGGNFIPLSSLPGPLATAALATPNGWAMRGFLDLAAGGGLRELVPALAAILAFAVVTLGWAALRADRILSRDRLS